VGFVAEDHLVARPGQDLEADLVCHRPARHEQCGLFVERFGDTFLQSVDRGIFAILVVTDRGRRHRLPHSGGRKGHRVGAQVDAGH